MSPARPRRQREWRAREETRIPERPYRDTAILHGSLGILICVFALVTGGDLGTAAIVAVGYVVVATAWSWWRFSQRIRAAGAAAGNGGGGGGSDTERDS